MQFNQLLTQAISKIDDYITLFSSLEDNPENILTSIYSGSYENLLTRIFDSSIELTGEGVEVHELQDHLYKILIPFLIELPIFKGKEIVYNPEKYPSPLHVLLEEREIAQIDIFTKQFTIIKHEEILMVENRLNLIEKDFDYNADEILKYEEFNRDIMKYGDTAIQKMKIGMNKAKYKKEVKDKYRQLTEMSLEIEQSIIAQRLRLESTKEQLKDFEEMQYKMGAYLRDNYKYDFIQ